MTKNAFETCPRCSAALQAGFAHKALGLSFVSPEKLEKFISIDEDLAHSGLRKLLPSKAEYYRSFCKGVPIATTPSNWPRRWSGRSRGSHCWPTRLTCLSRPNRGALREGEWRR
jgi:hypothetical protein